MSRQKVSPGRHHHNGFLGMAYRNFLGLRPENDADLEAIRAPRVAEYERKIARGEMIFETGRCDREAWWQEIFGGNNA